MQTYKNNSWKEKIDPAFDELINVHLDYIKNTHIDDGDKKKRYLSFDDESLKALERKRYPPLLKGFKPNPRNLKKFTNDIIAVGANPDCRHIFDYFNNMAKFYDNNKKKKSKKENKNKHSDAMKSNVMRMIEGLPWEDSRNYYKKRLEIYSSPEKTKAFIEGKSQKELTKDLLDIEMDIYCLMYQTGNKGYWDTKGESNKGNKRNTLDLIQTTIQQIYNAISISTYRKPLKELIGEARNNDASLYKAIHLDKTLFDADWVRKRIRKAFYSGDSTFLKQLGGAIKKPPISVKVTYVGAITILASLWCLGLYRLENNELMELLKASGVMIPEDPESFRKFMDRLKEDNIIEDIEKVLNEW